MNSFGQTVDATAFPGRRLVRSGRLLLLPASLYFSLNRFDVLPALLTAVCGCAPLSGNVHSGIGTALWNRDSIEDLSGGIITLVFLYLGLYQRHAWIWLAAYVFAIAVCFLPPLALAGWQAVWQPFQFQLTRPPMGATAYGAVLPRALEENNLIGRLFRLGLSRLWFCCLPGVGPPT